MSKSAWLCINTFKIINTCGSAGKESTCNVGDLGSIPELRRSLEKGKATHSIILAWRIPWTVHGVAKSWTQRSNWTERNFGFDQFLSYNNW